MSSRSEAFECHWRGSRLLLMAYVSSLGLAFFAMGSSAAPGWLVGLLGLACAAHAVWLVPRRILLTHPHAITGLRRNAQGWTVFSRASGWQPVRLCRDSLALPTLVVLRYVRRGRWLSESQCIPADAMAPESHRRLRVRLKFSRRRWQAA